MAQLYSKNQLTNPSAETGNLSGWLEIGGGMGVVEGGTDGNYCFALNSTFLIFGTIAQQKAVLITPSDFKVSCDFLPPVDMPGTSKVFGEMAVIYTYADGTKDEIIFPCRDDSGRGG